MIIEYHKPADVSEALKLLGRKNPKTVPLGGGTRLSQYIGEPLAVVSLEGLKLSNIWLDKNILHIGSMATIQSLVDCELIDEQIMKACVLDISHNLRQMATIGGCCASAIQSSLFLGLLMAGDAELVFQPDDKRIKINDWLSITDKKKPNGFISEVLLDKRLNFSFEKISRTPKSLPMLYVCGCSFPTGRIKLVSYQETNNRIEELVDFQQANSIINKKDIKNAYSQTHLTTINIYYSKILPILAKRIIDDLHED